MKTSLVYKDRSMANSQVSWVMRNPFFRITFFLNTEIVF